MEKEESLIFKSYLRLLLGDLKDIKAALQSEDYDRANHITDILIKDTEADIED